MSNNEKSKARHIKRMMEAAEKAGIKFIIMTDVKQHDNLTTDINLN